MTYLVTNHDGSPRILYGEDAEAARQGAAFAFLAEMEEHPEKGKLVPQSLVDRWYEKKGPGPDLGPPVDPTFPSRGSWRTCPHHEWIAPGKYRCCREERPLPYSQRPKLEKP